MRLKIKRHWVVVVGTKHTGVGTSRRGSFALLPQLLLLQLLLPLLLPLLLLLLLLLLL